ncbi:MAG TPA: hypothetical protein DCY00_06975 [Actinobacteria bacterium]|nr:hypothetical protein [Actinomycetota bacterium]
MEIVFKENKIEAVLNDTMTSKKLLKILPIKSEVNLWGNEVYFEIPIEAELENGRELMEIGNIAFWPSGNAFCIFFGPTPAGNGSQPRAISPVTVIGKIISEDGIEKLKKLTPSDSIEVRLANSRK